MADKKNGRPSVYSEEVAVELFSRMAGGESVRSICRDEHMPAISSRNTPTGVGKTQSGFFLR